MHGQIKDQGADNDRIARVLAHAVDSAGRSRADLAAEAGMHRETLTRLIRGERPIKFEDAARILSVCGVPVRSTLILALSGEDERACQWMRHDVGAFLEEFLVTLPGANHPWDAENIPQTRFSFKKMVEFFDRNVKNRK